MSKTFLIGSCEPFSGKSALVLGIARNLIASNHVVRFGKPLATSLEMNASEGGDIKDMIDDDVRFVGDTLKLSVDNLIPSIEFLAASTASKRMQDIPLRLGVNLISSNYFLTLLMKLLIFLRQQVVYMRDYYMD